MNTYAKFFVAVVGAVATVVALYVSDGSGIDDIEWCNIIIAAATAAGVWIAANVPGLIWAKTAVAVVLGAANFLVGTIADGVSSADWALLTVAVLTAAGVYAAPPSPVYAAVPKAA